jgi:molecular chaperone HscB
VISLQASDFELFGLASSFFARQFATRPCSGSLCNAKLTPTDLLLKAQLHSALQCNGRCESTKPTTDLKILSKRAAYLCELNGAAVNAENNTSMPLCVLDAANGMA